MSNRKAKLIATSIISIFGFLTMGLQPAQAASTQTIKNLYLSITIPKQIKMPKSGCSSFKMTYALGIKAKQKGYGAVYTALLIGSDAAAGVNFTYNLRPSTDRPEKGVATIEYCLDDWITEKGDARIGVVPGTYQFGFVTTFPDEVEKFGTIKIVR